MSRLVVVDYGVGNLLSVCRALSRCGAEPTLTDAPGDVDAADRLVLPGVGAFGDAMAALRERRLLEPLARWAERERPFLGICLGMQLMLDSSTEFGRHAGLGLVPGLVDRVPSQGADGTPHKVPHIGWSALEPVEGSSWEGTILAGLAPGESAYFVHSYAAAPADPRHRLADCRYDGLALAAVVRRGALYGCQFHPEKSGPVGLRILRNFCESK